MQGLPLDVVYIILGRIFSMLFSDLKSQELGNILTPAMIEFFQAGVKTNVYPLPVSWYFKSSSLW